MSISGSFRPTCPYNFTTYRKDHPEMSLVFISTYPAGSAKKQTKNRFFLFPRLDNVETNPITGSQNFHANVKRGGGWCSNDETRIWNHITGKFESKQIMVGEYNKIEKYPALPADFPARVIVNGYNNSNLKITDLESWSRKQPPRMCLTSYKYCFLGTVVMKP